MSAVVKNLELNIISRVLTRLKLINGTGNYNFNIRPDCIFEDFKMLEEIKIFPSLSMGSFRMGDSTNKPRNVFNSPFVLEVWGYVKDADHNQPLQEVSKLASDVRISLGFDEFLGNKVHGFTFSADFGAIGQHGYLRFQITGNFEFILV